MHVHYRLRGVCCWLQVTRSVDMGPGEYSAPERATMDAIVAAR